MKVNTLLAKTDHSAAQFKKLLTDTSSFFKNHQNHFRGLFKTYEALPDMPDFPSERADIKVPTTVAEKLNYVVETASGHLDNKLSLEATNASGKTKTLLTLDDHNFGELSTNELLYLKSFLMSGDLVNLYEHLPTREEGTNWTKSEREEYKKREVYETDQQTGQKKTTDKTTIILSDPNVQYLKDTSKYSPQTSVIDKTYNIGNYSVQHFHGGVSHHYRAGVLSRRTKLLNAVLEALSRANDVEAIKSQVSAEQIFNYLHNAE